MEKNDTVKVAQYDYREIVLPTPTSVLQKMATQYAVADRIANEMASIKKALKPQIIKENLKVNGFIAHSDIETCIEDNGKAVVVQIVNAVIKDVDAGLAKELLTPEQWALVEKVEVDRKKLFDAIQLGVIKPMIIAPAITTEPSTKLYVR
jgi:hypothetical protein